MNALSDMRRDYIQRELRREDMRDDPFEQFDVWFREACAAGIEEPNAMSLATASARGEPSIRTVLLKDCDARGLVFFTNTQSRKAQDLAENPHAALLFPWIQLERQIIVTGEARRISTAETLKYFLSRPRGSQLAALISQQSRPISSRRLLELEWERMKLKYAGGQIPLPIHWGGYRVVPRTIEFWQGRPNRLHDRFLYTCNADGSWIIERLGP